MLTRSGRYAARDQVECALRTIAGAEPGLTGRWCHGVATLRPGGLDFVGTVGGIRFLRRAPISVVIERVDRNDQRAPRGLEIVAVSSSARVMRINTPTALLEWAVLADRVAWAVGMVS